MTKFTKGEWELNYDGRMWSIWQDNTAIIDHQEYRFPCDKATSEYLDNAQLIVMAPAMYEYLDLLVNGDSINDHSIEKRDCIITS